MVAYTIKFRKRRFTLFIKPFFFSVAEEYGGPTKPQPSIDLSKLPSAPRASRGVDIDLSKLPSKPPYTAFLGNLPFETDEEDIVELFRGLKVSAYRAYFFH